MSKFLKFSNRIVNTAFIRYVDIDKNVPKYTLHLGNMHTGGTFIFGSGGFNSQESQVYATKTEHPESYAIIEKWVNSLECVSTKQHHVLATAALANGVASLPTLSGQPEVSEEKK